MRRPWWGPAPHDDQRAVLDLVDGLAGDRLQRVDDDSSALAAARQVLAGHGLWTLGADESAGGGGADRRTTLLTLARLAGTWPALAWAGVQAHAACLLAAETAGGADLLADVHRGEPVAVVDLADGQVEVVDSRVSGVLDRVDATAADPRVIALVDRDTAVLLPTQAVVHGPVLRRTGLGGAMTHACAVQGDVHDDDLVTGPAVERARTLLLAGAAAIAAGAAEAAAYAALSYSREREQFGGRLTDLPTVRASLSTQVATVRRLLQTAVEGTADDDPVAAAAALSPTLDDAVDVVAAAVQSHGGYGYMVEYRVEGLLRDVVSLRAASGATEAARRAADALVEAGT
jgi:alkylation response protein AidB-like acyl-CoA dehydrogenase